MRHLADDYANWVELLIENIHNKKYSFTKLEKGKIKNCYSPVATLKFKYSARNYLDVYFHPSNSILVLYGIVCLGYRCPTNGNCNWLGRISLLIIASRSTKYGIPYSDI